MLTVVVILLQAVEEARAALAAKGFGTVDDVSHQALKQALSTAALNKLGNAFRAGMTPPVKATSKAMNNQH